VVSVQAAHLERRAVFLIIRRSWVRAPPVPPLFICVNVRNIWAGKRQLRLILRKERPHPGVQLTFTDVDGHRITAFLADARRASSPGRQQVWNCGTASTPGLKTASAKASKPGLRNFLESRHVNRGWVIAANIAADLAAWTRLLGFCGDPGLGGGIAGGYVGGRRRCDRVPELPRALLFASYRATVEE
jgi:hypothetical protein